MKVILLGLALLQFASAQRDSRLPPPGDGEKSAYFEEVNMRRSDYAIKNNISNMNRVYYDMELEEMLTEEVVKRDFCPEAMLIKRNNSLLFLNIRGNRSIIGKEEVFVAGHTKTATLLNGCEDSYVLHFAFDVPIHGTTHGTPGSNCARASDGSLQLPGEKPDCVTTRNWNCMKIVYARKTVIENPLDELIEDLEKILGIKIDIDYDLDEEDSYFYE
ncbi:hypothetical protein CAEBREN_11493 [Caenorhabditis brenneri]|uniref:Uncharacterized protein n=1 Tax=Caenorhabditis brenneri TaxID=135651 RepID=G0NHT0_CAEBE|nr:hypothetical protein CAEBREN_11493 [Caenorhabditis brenneri]